MQRIIRENFGDWTFLEDQMPGANELGPRVTGGSVYKPEPPVTMSQRMRTAAENMAAKKKPQDHVYCEWDTDGPKPKVLGFNIHLAREEKTIFMPVREAEPDISMIDLMLLKDDPERFCKKYATAMIVSARQRLREGSVGTPEDLSEYRGESWMSPEQIAVLIDLRADRG